MPIEQLAETIPNVPGWERELILTGSGQSAYTFNITKTYDRVRVYPRDGFFDELQINGTTGTDYTFVEEDGTQTANATAFSFLGNFAGQSFFDIFPDKIGRIAVSFVPGSNAAINGAAHGTVQTSPPITSFTVLDSGGNTRDVSGVAFGLGLQI
jgi:hypothetical protein